LVARHLHHESSDVISGSPLNRGIHQVLGQLARMTQGRTELTGRIGNLRVIETLSDKGA